MSVFKRVFRFIAEPVTKIVDAWNHGTPRQQWYFFYNILKFMARTCMQLHCIFENIPIGPVGYVPGIICTLTPILLTYTTYFYTMSGNFVKCVPSFCVLGLAVSNHISYLCSVFKCRLWPMLIYPPSKYIYRDDRLPTTYNQICWNGLKESFKQCVFSISIILTSLFGAAIGPIYTYLQGGEIVTLFELRFPFCGNDPNTENLVSFVWQGLNGFFGFLGLILIEAGMALVNNTITVSSKLNRLSLRELSNRLESNDITGTEAHQKLKLIFMQIIYWDGYIEYFKELFYWRNFVSPPLFTFSIAISIYSQSVLEYPAGYGMAIASYIQMAILCYTGQNAKKRTDRLLTAISDFKWYLLPKEAQKDVMGMLYFLQNTKGPTVGPFQSLSYMTLKNLTQLMYKFLMFLSNFEV